MRGRTLADAIVILDEAQNTTTAQLKMFLTRLGIHGKMIITGDLTQIDLPASQKSGLKDAIERLQDIRGIAIVEFNQKDIVRHHLVKHIVAAYNATNHKADLVLIGSGLSYYRADLMEKSEWMVENGVCDLVGYGRNFLKLKFTQIFLKN